MNKVILMGRLTKDPVVTVSASNQSMTIARFTLAVDRRGRRDNGDNQQTADFISCVAFRTQAEFADKYLRKGTKIVLTGRIQTGSYTNRDGQRVYTTDVIAEELEFAESKAASQNNGFGGDYAQAPQRNTPAPQQAEGLDGFMNVPSGLDEELPFN